MVVIPALDTRTSVFWSTVSLNIWTIPLVRSGELFKTDCVLRLPFALRFAPLCGLWILGDVYNIECSRYIKTVICILIYSEKSRLFRYQNLHVISIPYMVYLIYSSH